MPCWRCRSASGELTREAPQSSPRRSVASASSVSRTKRKNLWMTPMRLAPRLRMRLGISVRIGHVAVMAPSGADHSVGAVFPNPTTPRRLCIRVGLLERVEHSHGSLIGSGHDRARWKTSAESIFKKLSWPLQHLRVDGDSLPVPRPWGTSTVANRSGKALLKRSSVPDIEEVGEVGVPHIVVVGRVGANHNA